MDLESIRTKIDETDREIRALLVRRMGYSHQVAQAKVESGNLTIYRADREASILETLGAQVEDEIKPEYLAVVRKVMEASRTYQYGLIYDWTEGAFESIPGHELGNEHGRAVRVRLSRENKPNAMSAILSMVGDHGFNMDRMTPIHANEQDEQVTFELVIWGDLSQTPMRKLMFQLAGETVDFQIIENIA